MKIIFLILTFSSFASAWDSSKCSKMMNNGLYKKYEWGGVGDYNINAMTNETNKSGSTTATAKISTEGSTAVVDPGYSTNVTKSESQSTSSWGECSLFGLQERKVQRDAFIAQNFDQIKSEAANGNGPYLEVLAWLSLCENGTEDKFNQVIQNNFQKIFLKSGSISNSLDQLVNKSPQLANKCYNFSSI